MKIRKQTEKEQSEIGKPSISVATVFSIVGLLFVVLVYAFYFFRYNQASPFYNHFSSRTETKTEPIQATVQSQIKKTTSGESVEIEVSESQLSSALCVKCDSFPLKKADAKLKPDGVVISGKTTTAFWGVNLEIIMKPKAEKGQIVFDLASFKAAGVAAPPSLTETYSQKLKDAFKDIIPGSGTVNITEVHPIIGKLVVVGTKK